MNRVIKFRAWDKKEKLMCEVEIINLKKGCFLIGNSPTPMKWIDDRSYIEEIKEGHFVYFTDLELMQFTGLLDKNKNEIYEGDIFGTPIQLRCVVEREEDGRWVLRFLDKRIKSISILDHKVSKSPIIGNVFQDPELISKP